MEAKERFPPTPLSEKAIKGFFANENAFSVRSILGKLHWYIHSSTSFCIISFFHMVSREKWFAKSGKILYNKSKFERTGKPKMFEAILDAIQAHETIIIHRHSTPDGDALGSQIGLKHLIRENYPGKTVFTVGDAAMRYSFMADTVMDQVPDEVYRDALAIVLDTSGRNLISDSRFETAKTTARIDHHLFIEQICQIEVIDSGFESCCGLIAQMALECGWKMPDIAAQSLFTGMVTDSGRFRYDSTSARTFRLASYLMERPIDTNEIYRQLYASSLDQVKLRAAFIQKIALTEHGVGYIYTTREEMAEIDADLFSISRGMVSVMNDITGMDIWANFTECEKGVLCELRSSRFNINPIAVKYGGGGHMKASGAPLKNREEAMLMLADLDKMAEENS